MYCDSHDVALRSESGTHTRAASSHVVGRSACRWLSGVGHTLQPFDLDLVDDVSSDRTWWAYWVDDGRGREAAQGAGVENVRLKRIVAEKELEIDALREVARGDW